MWTQRPSDCAAGDELLSRGAWSEARAAFEAMLRERETPEALEGLGLAAWWLDDADAVFDSRERAYVLAILLGDHPKSIDIPCEDFDRLGKSLVALDKFVQALIDGIHV